MNLDGHHILGKVRSYQNRSLWPPNAPPQMADNGISAAHTLYSDGKCNGDYGQPFGNSSYSQAYPREEHLVEGASPWRMPMANTMPTNSRPYCNLPSCSTASEGVDSMGVSWIMAAILPISVSMPMWVTTNRPFPDNCSTHKYTVSPVS